MHTLSIAGAQASVTGGEDKAAVRPVNEEDHESITEMHGVGSQKVVDRKEESGHKLILINEPITHGVAVTPAQRGESQGVHTNVAAFDERATTDAPPTEEAALPSRQVCIDGKTVIGMIKISKQQERCMSRCRKALATVREVISALQNLINGEYSMASLPTKL